VGPVAPPAEEAFAGLFPGATRTVRIVAEVIRSHDGQLRDGEGTHLDALVVETRDEPLETMLGSVIRPPTAPAFGVLVEVLGRDEPQSARCLKFFQFLELLMLLFPFYHLLPLFRY